MVRARVEFVSYCLCDALSDALATEPHRQLYIYILLTFHIKTSMTCYVDAYISSLYDKRYYMLP